MLQGWHQGTSLLQSLSIGPTSFLLRKGQEMWQRWFWILNDCMHPFQETLALGKENWAKATMPRATGDAQTASVEGAMAATRCIGVHKLAIQLPSILKSESRSRLEVCKPYKAWKELPSNNDCIVKLSSEFKRTPYLQRICLSSGCNVAGDFLSLAG